MIWERLEAPGTCAVVTCDGRVSERTQADLRGALTRRRRRAYLRGMTTIAAPACSWLHWHASAPVGGPR